MSENNNPKENRDLTISKNANDHNEVNENFIEKTVEEKWQASKKIRYIRFIILSTLNLGILIFAIIIENANDCGAPLRNILLGILIPSILTEINELFNNGKRPLIGLASLIFLFSS